MQVNISFSENLLLEAESVDAWSRDKDRKGAAKMIEEVAAESGESPIAELISPSNVASLELSTKNSVWWQHKSPQLGGVVLFLRWSTVDKDSKTTWYCGETNWVLGSKTKATLEAWSG